MNNTYVYKYVYIYLSLYLIHIIMYVHTFIRRRRVSQFTHARPPYWMNHKLHIYCCAQRKTGVLKKYTCRYINIYIYIYVYCVYVHAYGICIYRYMCIRVCRGYTWVFRCVSRVCNWKMHTVTSMYNLFMPAPRMCQSYIHIDAHKDTRLDTIVVCIGICICIYI